MMGRINLSGKSAGSVFCIFLVLFNLFISPAISAETVHKVIELRQIAAEQGQKYLQNMGLGTVSILPGGNVLLITAPKEELYKAEILLDIVDSEFAYVIQKIESIAQAKELASNQQIAKLVDGISIGTFDNPPSNSSAPRVIVAQHNNSLYIVAPIDKSSKIMSALKSGRTIQGQTSNGNNQNVMPAMFVEGAEQPTEIIAEDETSPEQPSIEDLMNMLAQSEEELSQTQPSNEPETNATIEEQPKPEQDISEIIRALQEQAAEMSPTIESHGTEAAVEEPVAETPTESAGSETPAPAQMSMSQTIDNILEAGPSATKPTVTGSTYVPPPAPNGEDLLNMDLPERLSIVSLLELVGEFLQLNYIYNPADIQGEVTLKISGKLQGKLRVKDLYPMLESTLQIKGLVMNRIGNMVYVTKDTDAFKIDPKLMDDVTTGIETGNGIVTRVFTLKHIDTASITNLLGNMDLAIKPVPVGETRTIIVTGYAHRMDRIEKIIKMVDIPGEPKQFKFRQLKNTYAKPMIEKVKSLADELGTTPITIESLPETTVVRIQSGGTSTSRELNLPRAGGQTPKPIEESPVYLDADERTNRILMIGLKGQLESVNQLIDALDVEQMDLRKYKSYPIENIDADEVKSKLEELGIIGQETSTQSSSGRITGESVQPVGTTGAASVIRSSTTRSGSETTSALVEPPQVVVIEAKNALLIYATDEQHEQIAEIIKHLDSKTLKDTIPYVIYPLENQDPVDLAEILEQLIQETILDEEGKVTETRKKIEDNIVIVPDENTFSLIVYASKKNQEWIKNLIDTLDMRRPQVLIDVTLVEISETDNFEFDLDMITSAPDLIQTSGQIGMFPSGDGTVIDKLLEPGAPSQFADFQFGASGVKGFYADVHINALLTAIETKNYGRVLAKPKILVNDNQTGTIATTDTTWVQKKSSIPVSAGTAGSDGSLIETQVDFQDYSAGITLDIKPHISEGNLLNLEINLHRSDFVPTEGEKPPDSTNSDINTNVTVPDGSTIILGGMTKLNQSKGGSKVPILGDLPFIGGAFRSVANSNVNRKLYVFVKGEIIRPNAQTGGLQDLVRISERNRSIFEEFEREFQNYSDFPGFPSKPMKPLRVLETDTYK